MTSLDERIETAINSLNISERRKQKIRQNMEQYRMTLKDALILDQLEWFQSRFDNFMEDVLQIRATPQSEKYHSRERLEEFYRRRRELSLIITDAGILLRDAHEHLISVHTEVIKNILDELSNIKFEGEKDQIFNFVDKVERFVREISSALQSGKPEKMLEVLDIASMDYTKLYERAMRGIGRHKDARIVFDVLCSSTGSLTVKELENIIGKGRTWVSNAIEELLANAGQVVKVGVVSKGGVEEYAYGVPAIYKKMHQVK